MLLACDTKATCNDEGASLWLCSRSALAPCFCWEHSTLLCDSTCAVRRQNMRTGQYSGRLPCCSQRMVMSQHGCNSS